MILSGHWLLAPVAAGVLLGLAGCGEGAPPSAEQRQRAEAAGFAADLVYVTEVDGYDLAAGGSGVYGDAGYQAIYSSSRGDDLRLTVERASLDAGTCPALPIPGAESAAVRCVRDGDGWSRVAGDRREYAVAEGDRLVRVSGTSAATSPEMVRSAAVDARPATGDELEALLPPASTVVERGDIKGDSAPDNGVGAGG
jgi:hypothetical protein